MKPSGSNALLKTEKSPNLADKTLEINSLKKRLQIPKPVSTFRTPEQAPMCVRGNKREKLGPSSSWKCHERQGFPRARQYSEPLVLEKTENRDFFQGSASLKQTPHIELAAY